MTDIEDEPTDGTFFIERAMGLSKDNFELIVAQFQVFKVSNLNTEEIVKASVKGRNPFDVMVGFKLATLVYENEGRL